ncbi:MAG: SirA family protein [Chloroflexi bacterium]|nr:SirA family protein [Chloroflexota bacterium]
MQGRRLMLTVDARGFSCPEPVIQSQNGLKMVQVGEQVEVLVETVTSRENVRRMAENKGHLVTVEVMDDGFRLIITRQK